MLGQVEEDEDSGQDDSDVDAETAEELPRAATERKRKATTMSSPRKRLQISSGLDITSSVEEASPELVATHENSVPTRGKLRSRGQRKSVSIVVEELRGPDLPEPEESELGPTLPPSPTRGLKADTEPIWTRMLGLRPTTRYVARFLTLPVRGHNLEHALC